jgi:hypothetical protein
MHAHLIPSYYLERVVSTMTMTVGEPLRARAERLRTPLFAPGRALGALNTVAQNTLKAKATKLAEVFQHSSSNKALRAGWVQVRPAVPLELDMRRRTAYGKTTRSDAGGAARLEGAQS